MSQESMVQEIDRARSLVVEARREFPGAPLLDEVDGLLDAMMELTRSEWPLTPEVREKLTFGLFASREIDPEMPELADSLRLIDSIGKSD